ncbi:MAG: inorganic phosphate transporter [Caulobacteraceae bacterium]
MSPRHQRHPDRATLGGGGRGASDRRRPHPAGLVAVALTFDFLNGLHDAANSIATIVSTRVLRPRYAVAWAAAFNFIAFLFFGLHVAKTIGAGIVDVALVTDRLIFGALMGAIAWNIITWLARIPSSSSHALVGGLIGAAWRRREPRRSCSTASPRPPPAIVSRRRSASPWRCCWC